MSNLSDLIGGGGSGGGKTADFVATGTIANGVAVVLNSNGTVSEVSAEGYPSTVGNASVFISADVNSIKCAYDPVAKKVGVIYRQSGTSRCVMGSIANGVATFGTPVVLNSNGSFQDANAIIFDPTNTCWIVMYGVQDAYSTGHLYIQASDPQNYSGNNFNFYSPQSVENYIYGSFSHVNMTFDTDRNDIIFTFRYAYPYNSQYVRRATYSGTQSFSYSTTYLIGNQGDANFPNDIIYDTASNHTIIGYQRSNYKYFRAIHNNANFTLTVGSEYNPSINDLYNLTMVFDPVAGKTLCAYGDYYNSSSGVGSFFLLTYNGSSFSKTTAVQNSNYTSGMDYINMAFDSDTNQIGIFFREINQPLAGKFIIASISGSTISFGSTTTAISTASLEANDICYDSDQKTFFMVIRDYQNNNYGTSKTVTAPKSNNTEYVGISAAAIANSATGTVTLRGGVAENLSSLSPNSAYYVQSSGTISTTVSSQSAGKALSATKLLLTGQT